MQRSAEIQGLRAIAVTLVLLFHTGWIRGGYIGVDIFYVISGYLITSLIIKDENFSFKRFYTRRAKRLLPASFFVLFVSSILFWFLAPVVSRLQFSKDLLASTWYVSNYLYAHWQNDYQNLGATPSPFIHFWSLAVEEQFYLFWPLFLYLGRRNLKLTVTITTISSFILSLFLVRTAPIFAFYSLPTRAFELGIGATLAIFKMKNKFGWIGLIGIALSAFIFSNHTAFPAIPALLPTFAGALIVSSTKAIPLLQNRFLQIIGDWSYSIYLWHWPLLVIPSLYLQRELTLLEKCGSLIVCLILSKLTFTYIETPMRVKKWSPSQTAVRALVSGLVLTSMAIFIGANSATALDLNKIRVQPMIYADGCQLDKGATKPNPKCVYGDLQSNRKIVLFGDSHAAQWFPALEQWAKSRHFRLIVLTKSSCPAIALPLKDNGAFKAQACNQFRMNALKYIRQMHPDLVVIGNFEHYSDVTVSDYVTNTNFQFKYLLIRDTPWPNRDIPACLTTKNQCTTPKPFTIPYKSPNIFDPVPLMCTSKCPAMVDGLVAYRDQTHITVALSEHLALELNLKLDSLVAG